MQDSKKETPKYVTGIRIFQKKSGQPCFSGVITPNDLFDFLKSGEADGAKSEYQGKVQYKFSLWTNEDGTANMQLNEWQPSQEDNSNEPFDKW